MPSPACVAAAHVPAPTPAAPNPKALSPAVIARGAAIPATATVATIFSYQLFEATALFCVVCRQQTKITLSQAIYLNRVSRVSLQVLLNPEKVIF